MSTLVKSFSKTEPKVMETARVPAESDGNSMDFVSYRAKKNWRRLWDVYFADYLPADKFDERIAQENKQKGFFARSKPSGGVIQLTHHFFKQTQYRGSETALIASNLTFLQAVQMLREKEASFNINIASNYVSASSQNPHEDHFSNFIS